MNEEKTQIADGVASVLNAELDALLPLAAKAIGLKVQYSNNWGDYSIGEPYSKNEQRWNPLEFDKDAFCLLVELEMTIDFQQDSVSVFSKLFDRFDIPPCIRHFGDDKKQNTRIAIVQCAAEIGKQTVSI